MTVSLHPKTPRPGAMSLGVKLCQALRQQQWLSLKHKKLLYRKLVAAGNIPDAPFEADFFGLRYQR